MTDITPALTVLQQESYEFNASVSEAAATEKAQNLNLATQRGNATFDIELAGAFRPLNGGEGKVFVPIWDVQITGIVGYIRVTGVSGTSTIDIHKISTAGADTGSILSTPLSISSAASDGIVFGTNFLGATSNAPTGVTLPVASDLLVSAFEGLRVDIDGNASTARDLFLQIHYRAYTS